MKKIRQYLPIYILIMYISRPEVNMYECLFTRVVYIYTNVYRSTLSKSWCSLFMRMLKSFLIWDQSAPLNVFCWRRRSSLSPKLYSPSNPAKLNMNKSNLAVKYCNLGTKYYLTGLSVSAHIETR